MILISTCSGTIFKCHISFSFYSLDVLFSCKLISTENKKFNNIEQFMSQVQKHWVGSENNLKLVYDKNFEISNTHNNPDFYYLLYIVLTYLYLGVPIHQNQYCFCLNSFYSYRRQYILVSHKVFLSFNLIVLHC